MNCPSGASVSPEMLRPQQRMVPSVRNPHACCMPALMAPNCPLGACNCPYLFEPQQRMAPSARNPHEYLSPEEMAVKRVFGGSASPA